jgi:hypothetical protein
MRFQKIPHGLSLVRRKIIQNDVDLLLRPALRYNLAEEIHEVGAGVARRGFSVHASGLGVQRGIQRQRAVAVIFKPVALGAARRQRQKTGFRRSNA